MPIDITTQTSAKAVFDRIIERVTDSTFMGGATPAWDILNEYQHWPGVSTATDADASKHRHSYVLMGKGEAGADKIYVGLAYSERQAVAPFADAGLPATGNIRLFGFQKFTSIMDGVSVHSYKGDWSGENVEYALGNIVKASGVTYLCCKAHTSNIGENAPNVIGQTTWSEITPFDSTYGAFADYSVNDWVLFSYQAVDRIYKKIAVPTSWPDWAGWTSYTTTSKVKKDGRFFLCIQNHAITIDPTGGGTAINYWMELGVNNSDKPEFSSNGWNGSNTGLWAVQTPYKGAWGPDVTYTANDYVLLGTKLYKALSTHVSSGGNGPTGEKGATYWMKHTPHYKSQYFGKNREGRFTEDEGFVDQWQTGLCWSGFHKMWKEGLGNIPLWLCANSRRFMWVTKSSTTRWHFSYAGFLKPFGTASTNPYPLLLAANCVKQSTQPLLSDKWWEAQHCPYDYVEEDNITAQDGWLMQNYPLGNAGAMFSRLDLSWVQAPIPYPYSQETALGVERLPTGENYLREVWLHDGQGFVGALDGVYWCAAQGMASGDILTANSVDYLVIENVYRASSGGVFAIRLE